MQREQEMVWLTERELRDVIDARRIHLITYRELGTADATVIARAETEVITL